MAKGSKQDRKRKRYTVRDFQVEYTPDNLFSFFRKSASGRQPLVDMSASGLQFLAEKQLKVGDTIRMTISAPIFASPVKARGKIVWTQQIPRQTLFRTGVEMLDIDEDLQKKLDAFEEKIQEFSIRVLCNSCGSAFSVKKKHEGARGKCPNCKKTIEIVEVMPEGGPAQSGVHVAAPGASTVEPRVPAATKDIPQKIQRFLIKACPTRIHLAIIEHLYSTRATVFSADELAKAIGQTARVTRSACSDLEGRAILKAVGTKTFNYAPSPESKRDIEEVMRLSRDSRRRSKVLSFVLANERRK